MNVPLLLRTVIHLRPTQIIYQLRYRLHRPQFKEVSAPQVGETPRLMVAPISHPQSWNAESGTLTFLNIEDSPLLWNDARHGALWVYNLNYMDWLLQSNITTEQGAEWIDRFIDGLPQNAVGLDPYPTSLRGLNWIKFIALHRDTIADEKLRRWHDSLYAQYALLTKRLEYHLLGNHLLEDAYSLCFGAIYVADKKMWRKARTLLRRELEEQVFADGAHYEQSPMYHCILLDRLLDVYNFSTSNPRF